MRLNSKYIAWLCLLLIFGSAVAFAVHQHAGGTDEVKCTVCVAAHSTSPATPPPVPETILLPVATVTQAPVAAAKQRLIAFALAVRPPPES